VAGILIVKTHVTFARFVLKHATCVFEKAVTRLDTSYTCDIVRTNNRAASRDMGKEQSASLELQQRIRPTETVICSCSTRHT
jgi:hypothetical protein